MTLPRTVWMELAPLLRAKHVPAACFKAFYWLWGQTVDAQHPQGKPDYLCIATTWMAGEIGRDPRSTKETLDRLHALGVIEIVDRDDRRGVRTLYVYRPNPGQPRPKRPDLQGWLPIIDGPQSGITAPQSPVPGITAQQSPPTLNRESTTTSRRQPGITAQQSPRPFHGTIDKEDLTLPLSHRQSDSMAMEDDPAEESDPKAGPMHVGHAIAGAIDRLSKRQSTTAQKRRLVGEILRTVDDPELDNSIAGRAADLVVEGTVEEGRLRVILRDIQQIREAHQTGTGRGFKTSAGAFFLFKVRQWPDWINAKRDT